MKRGRCTTLLFLVLAAAVSSCSHGSNVNRPSTQDNFGVQMAKSNLWREAMFRFKRAVELDPTNATAHNNLAVAYEANGDFDLAAKEYREALRLDRTNQYIQKNYSRYTEFLSRNKKRGAKDAKATAAAAPASSRPSGVTSGPSSGPPAGGPVPAATPGTPGSAEPMTPPSSAPPPSTQQPPPTPPPAPTTANAPGGAR
ncbi:MAG: yrrB 4 [Acidobacteria bacterium]|nr:yrrB 4 [Acidobacteriota bacterium]